MRLKGKRSQTNIRMVQRENKKQRGGGSTCDWTGKECICHDGTAENADERTKIENDLICNPNFYHWTGEKCIDRFGVDVQMTPLCKELGARLMDERINAMTGKSKRRKRRKRKRKTKKRKTKRNK